MEQAVKNELLVLNTTVGQGVGQQQLLSCLHSGRVYPCKKYKSSKSLV
jgi:hypothetical protein